MKKPNVIFVFSDQHRAQACGYAGDPNVQTPNLDHLAGESINLCNMISGMPVCCPWRASFLTGQYALSHGIFLNDASLEHRVPSIAEAFAAGGYDTAYIGKWHVDGHGRSGYIPPERRQGFDYWKVLECTHNYNHSLYYDNDSKTPSLWEGYDAFAQTDDAIRLLKEHKGDKPLFLTLSWGPPHNPYETAPKEFRELYDPKTLQLRDNVPGDSEWQARSDLAGYYGHVSALDHCIGRLMQTVDELGIREDTIFVYTSDHGDMLGSQGTSRKQKPWEESIRVPFLLRYPRRFGENGKVLDMPMNTPDIMPTLLDLAGVAIPDTVEGRSYVPALEEQPDFEVPAVLIECIAPFGEWHKNVGGVEYRGVRTRRYTYVRTLHGPWLLFDNERDPYQLQNLLEEPGHEALQQALEQQLQQLLRERGDAFLPGKEYVRQWGYEVDCVGTIPYDD